MSTDISATVRLKVFICYAREKAKVLDRFVEGFTKSFEEYAKVYDFELLIDLKPHAGNMHTRFRNFARTCHIALLLANSRFIQNDSYANQHEIPILLRRAIEKKVLVLGIRLTDIGKALNEWNKKGEFYFAPIRNIELPFTRRKESGNERYLNDFAIYQTIEPGDEDTYHRILLEQIIELLKIYTALEPEPLEDEPVTDLPQKSIRNHTITDEILRLMSENLLLKKLEDNLSRDVYLWQAACIELPEDKESYAWWYCAWHARWYADFQLEIKKMPVAMLREVRKQVEVRLKEKNILMRRLTDGLDATNFQDQIERSERLFSGLKTALIQTNNWQKEMNLFKEELVNRLLLVSEILDDWSNGSFQLVEIDLV